MDEYDPTLNLKPLLKSVDIETETILEKKNVKGLSQKNVILSLETLVERFEDTVMERNVDWLDRDLMNTVKLGICILITIKNFNHYCKIMTTLKRNFFMFDMLFNKEKKNQRWFVVIESDTKTTNDLKKAIKDKGLRVLEKHRLIDRSLFQQLDLINRTDETSCESNSSFGDTELEESISNDTGSIRILFNTQGNYSYIYRGLDIKF